MGHKQATARRAGFVAIPLLAVALLAGTGRPAGAQGDGDAEAGARLAGTWCSSCHLAGPAQQSAASTGAPTFAAIAAMQSLTPASLRNFLQVPHGRMSDLSLTREDTDNLAAYILSLRKP